MEKVAIVGGCRTPFVRAGGAFAGASTLDLALPVTEELVKKLDLARTGIDELIFSTVLLDPRTPNMARELLLRSSLPKSVPAHFISNNCISGLVAVNAIAEGIQAGRIRSGLAGGSEAMSRPTLTISPAAEKFFLGLARARNLSARLSLFAKFRPAYLMPQAPSPKEPSTGMTMGQHCEISAKEFKISRESQDQWALRSHQNAAKAQEQGILTQEIVPYQGVLKDNIIRADTSLEKLAKLPPVFDRSPTGTLTAGNSSSLTDGASAICLMSESEAKRRGLKILGFLLATQYSALPPSEGLLMAPALALPALLERTGLKLDQVDRFEIHEAFAAQVCANRQAWEEGWSRHPELKALGKIPDQKINLNGGSLAIGHPFAATGGRLIISLLNELERSNTKTGVISVCAAGGMACAMLLGR